MSGIDDLPVIKAVELLRLEPNDALIVKVDGRISPENAESLKRALEAKFPGRTILVCGDDVDISVIRSA